MVIYNAYSEAESSKCEQFFLKSHVENNLYDQVVLSLKTQCHLNRV